MPCSTPIRGFSATQRHDLAEIRRAPLLAGLSDAALHRLLDISATQALPRGATLVEQGAEEMGMLHILLSGRIGLRAVTEDGAATLLGILKPGDAVLLPSLLLRVPAEAAAQTLTAARVLMVPAAAFRRLLAEEPALAAAAMQVMAAQCRALSEQLVDVKLRGAEERLTRFLLRRAAPAMAGPAIVDLPEPKCAVALRLGMTPESLSRTLAGLERRGVIRQQGGRLALLRQPERAAAA